MPGIATLFALALAGVGSATPPPADSGDSIGVLVMAHGGGKSWNAAVLDMVAPLRKELPVEVAFGMADACSLRDAVRKLEATGVSRVAVVRLFISGESFLEPTEQILGLRPGAPAATAKDCAPTGGMAGMAGDHAHMGHAQMDHDTMSMALFRIDSPLHFAISSEGLADAPEMGAVLVDRARQLSHDPAKEDVVILAHGPGDDGENSRWLEKIGARADEVRRAIPFHHVEVRTLREDWPEKRTVAEAEIRQAIAASQAAGRTTLVIPYRVEGFGPYAAVLRGLTYTSDGKGLLPHPNVAAWISRQVNDLAATLAKPAQAGTAGGAAGTQP